MAKGKANRAKNGQGESPENGTAKLPIDRAQSTPRILAELEAYSRAPLQRELAKWMDCAPDPESLRAFAKRQPDRWSQGVASLVRGAGYSEKLQVSSNIAVLIGQLSDSQMMERLAEALRKLGPWGAQLEQCLKPHGEQKAIEAGAGESDAEDQREGEQGHH